MPAGSSQSLDCQDLGVQKTCGDGTRLSETLIDLIWASDPQSGPAWMPSASEERQLPVGTLLTAAR